MNHPDIIISICQHQDDIEKFNFLSAAKWLDIMKGKLLFNDPVHLYWIYFHRYFHHFTNIIVCKKVESIVLPNGIVIRKKKPRFPKFMRKIELQNRVNYLYHDLFPEGITHIKINRNEDLQTYQSQRRKRSIFPETLTHLILGHKNCKIDVKLPASLQFIDVESVGTKSYDFSQSPNLQHITSRNLFPFPDITSIKCLSDNLKTLPITVQKLSLHCGSMVLLGQDFNFNYFTNLKYLNLEKNEKIHHTIQFPPNITHLKISGNWRVDYFPITLIYLELCDLSNITNFNCFDFPNLTHLIISYLFPIMEHNYPKLYHLECKYFSIPVQIPTTITHFKINNYLGPIIWHVPSHVNHLTLYTDFSPTYECSHVRPNISNIVYSDKIKYLDISSEVIEIKSLSINLTKLIVSPKCYTLNKKILTESDIIVHINRNYDDPFASNWDSEYTGCYHEWYDD